MCHPARHLYEENRNTSAEVQGMSFEIPACETSSIESLEGDRTYHLQTPQELDLAGNIEPVKQCVAIMRTSTLARKHDSRDTIQCAEFQYSPSGAVVSLTSYDGDHPAFRTGIHQNSKEMCRYSENHE